VYAFVQEAEPGHMACELITDRAAAGEAGRSNDECVKLFKSLVKNILVKDRGFLHLYALGFLFRTN